MINFSDKENRDKLLEIEKNSLNATLDIQKNLNKQILVFMKNFIGNIEITPDFDHKNKALYYITESTCMLNKSNKNIENIQKLIKALDNISVSIHKKGNIDNIEHKIESYNKKFNNYINSVYENTSSIEKFIHTISMLDLSQLMEEINEKVENETINEEANQPNITISADNLNHAYVENTLVISDMQGKIILPYKLETIKEILLDAEGKYASIDDVINQLYTIPLKEYKFSAIARFKEAYKLMIKKEHSSKLKALSLAFELFTNYNLHPAIITACSSLDELDIYLACLEDNVLEDFHFFDVKYEIPPAIVKNEETL